MDYMEQAARNNERWVFGGFYGGRTLEQVLAYIKKHREEHSWETDGKSGIWSDLELFYVAAKLYNINFIAFCPGSVLRWQPISANFDGSVGSPMV
jgi:hypothetical protein